ncbi:chalcone isomerase family protein [Chitinibacter sp. ZOR0017]|uniref:chalcone isomerase family protein n=1 Tax=Chitinibacter sp. ZOR0017 TaxID=1339254 RepID=UPI0009DE1ADC|nr:chalcone isomerase family protein [Chitinibacter sp. ZOR0017]
MSFNSVCKSKLARGIAIMAFWGFGWQPIPALANVWRADLPQAKVVGSGDLHWLGLRIYTARLWSESPRLPAAWASGVPFALELTYHRSISRAQFVSTSSDEIARLLGPRYDEATRQRWEGLMQRAFTDVEPGQQLIGVFRPGVGCTFYSAERQLAEIRDPQFAEAFFAIWLDPRTKDQGLRAKLLGAAP